MIARAMDWFKRWIDDIRSTNLTIVVGLELSILYVVWGLAADTFGRPITSNTLDTIGLFIASLVTGGVVQFAVKRHTDDKAIAAKTGATPAPRQSTAVPVQGEP